MDILILGGGGREHAVALALARSPRTGRIWVAPGNGGTAAFCENVPLAATDLAGVLSFCREKKPDFVVVTPDDPLALGFVDVLEGEGFPCFGPTQAAAQLESSKSFAKDFMARHHIPTAACVRFDDEAAARAHVRDCAVPVVLKKDGLAQGKGVVVAMTRDELLHGLDALCAGGFTPVLFEQFLTGPEVSVLCFTDGETIVPMPAAQDHKRAFDGDRGDNTGGMGAFTPVSVYTDELAQRCMKEIFRPTVDGMAREGVPFRGVLYFSLMLTPDGPQVIEYNARFGDPETQAVLPLLETDLLSVMRACREGTLRALDVRFAPRASACVVMASGGYPSAYRKGFPISGIDRAEARGCTVFHAGTATQNGALVTSGGRVLAVQAAHDTLYGALTLAYEGVQDISFEGAFFRRDIGQKDACAQQTTRGTK